MECPIMMTLSSDKDRECRKQHCSWWIPEEKCCAVVAIYQKVTEKPEHDIVAQSNAEVG